MDQPEDYKKLGIKENKVEPWEDGKRNDDSAGAIEWWYFDAIMDDGTKVGLSFCTKTIHGSQEKGYHPFVYYNIQFPDGTVTQDFMLYSHNDIEFGEENCNVKVGPHSFVGNLKEYAIKIDPVKGVGVDLKLTSQTQSWRPGSAYISFENDMDEEAKFFTWLCAVPKGKVTGTITFNGKTIEVQGTGYHDHQWGSIEHCYAWNHWLWARQHTEDYTIVLFDLVTTKEYGYKRYPLFFVQDKEGNIIFENTENVQCEVTENYLQEKSNKYQPKVSKYTFESNGTKAEYILTANKEIVFTDHYSVAPEGKKAEYDRIGAKPTYTRFNATGKLVITTGDKTLEISGDLLYEISYFYKSYKEHENSLDQSR